MHASNVAVIGCGAFGYALSVTIAQRHRELAVRVTDADPAVLASLRSGVHPYFHEGVRLPSNVVVCDTAAEAVRGCDRVLLVMPAQVVRRACASFRDALEPGAILLNTAKALEAGTAERLSVVIGLEVPGHPIAALGGGMLAHDVAQGKAVGAELACEDKQALDHLAVLFEGTAIRVETTTDIVGVEYGSAFKNVIAIGAGIVDGLGWGNSSKSFFIARSLREIENLAISLGARHETFHTASNFWMGDLMTSCFGDGRNRLFGELIGKGYSREAAEADLVREHKHAEGVATLAVVVEMLERQGVDAPVMRRLHAILYRGERPETLLAP